MIKTDSYLIVGGTIINPDVSGREDMAVSGGKIEAIGNLDPMDYVGYERIEATGKYIIPGGIDPHVHLALPTPAGCSTDDFESGSLAALSGGTTSIIDFITPTRGQSLLEALALRRTEAAHSLCDYRLHLGISEWNPRVAEEVLHCIRHEKIFSFKAYLAYRETIGIGKDDLKQLMELVGREGGIVLVHCEDGDMISTLQQQFLKEGKTQAFYHALSRPPKTEINAIRSVINLSEQTNCPVYIVHTSTGMGSQLIYDAKNQGLKVYGETCIQYLVLDNRVYDPSLPNQKVLPYVISPPLRTQFDQHLLWQGLAKGAFDTIATDHCPFNLRGQKERGLNDFTHIPNGAGGIEYRMSLLYTFGVLTGILNMEQFVKVTSSNAAEIFGWGNTKGKLLPGFDSDIVLWNPEINWVIDGNQQVQQCDSNIYQGIPVKGKADRVLTGSWNHK